MLSKDLYRSEERDRKYREKTQMAKKNLENSENYRNQGNGAITNLSNNLLNGLTQEEIAQLIDALFGVLSLELQEKAIAKLDPVTQETVKQILLESNERSRIELVGIAISCSTISDDKLLRT